MQTTKTAEMRRLQDAPDDGEKRRMLELAGTVEQAVLDMIDLDRSCDINLRAMATGRPLQLIPPEAAEERPTAERFRAALERARKAAR